MPKKPRAIVLDSGAVIAYLEDEDAAAKVAELSPMRMTNRSR